MISSFGRHFFWISLTSLLCQSCQLMDPYQAPCTPTPTKWKQAPFLSKTSHAPSFERCKKELEYWWQIFEDPLLDQLEEQAMGSSYTLWAALERIIQARAIAREDLSSLLPSIGFNPSFSRSGMLMENIFGDLINQQGQNRPCPSSSANPAVPLAPLTAAATAPRLPSSFRVVQSQYMLPFDLNYEVDLWGRLTHTYEAAVLRSQAAAQAYLSVLLTLTADVASHYFQLRDLDSQRVVLENTIKAREQALEINQARFKAGLIVYLDVSRAEVELERAKADLADIIRLRGLEENRIASLVGIPAPVFSLDFHPLTGPLPSIPAGLPSDLLYRRPDIAEAERNLAAAYEEIGVAYAAFFPSLNLNATLGLESPFAHSLFTWKARLWEVGLQVMQTVFDGGRRCANLAYYKSLFREALANYEERVLTAFQDVEDSLVSIRQKAIQGEALDAAVRAATETLKLAQMRYQRGLINYLDVVDAERTLLQTQQNAAIVLGDRYVSTIRLIKALGGGWGRMHHYCRSWETD